MDRLVLSPKPLSNRSAIRSNDTPHSLFSFAANAAARGPICTAAAPTAAEVCSTWRSRSCRPQFVHRATSITNSVVVALCRGKIGLPLPLLPDQLRRLLARRAVHRRRNVDYSVDLRRHGSRRSLSVTSARLSSPLCRIGFRLAPAERRRLTLRRTTQGFVLSLEAFDSPQKLPNLSFAISELPLQLRDLPVLLCFFLAHQHTPPAGYSSLRHMVNSGKQIPSGLGTHSTTRPVGSVYRTGLLSAYV